MYIHKKWKELQFRDEFSIIYIYVFKVHLENFIYYTRFSNMLWHVVVSFVSVFISSKILYFIPLKQYLLTLACHSVRTYAINNSPTKTVLGCLWCVVPGHVQSLQFCLRDLPSGVFSCPLFLFFCGFHNRVGQWSCVLASAGCVQSSCPSFV